MRYLLTYDHQIGRTVILFKSSPKRLFTNVEMKSRIVFSEGRGAAARDPYAYDSYSQPAAAESSRERYSDYGDVPSLKPSTHPKYLYNFSTEITIRISVLTL